MMPPAEAANPLSVKARMRTALTRMPASRAASALPPAAYRYRPTVVRASSRPSRTITTRAIQIEVRTPRKLVWATSAKLGSPVSTMRFPLETSLAMPPMMNDMARVAISELILSTVLMTPLSEADDDSGDEPATTTRGHPVMQRGLRGDHRCQRVRRADREVDAAADQHEGAGRRDDERRRLLVEDVEQVVPGQERAALDRQRDEEQRRTGSGSPTTARAARRRAPAQVRRWRGHRRGSVHCRFGRSWSFDGRAGSRRMPRSTRSPPSCWSPVSSATIAPPRITRTRWASPSTSSRSEEMTSTPSAVGGLRDQQVVDRPLATRRRRRGSARRRSAASAAAATPARTAPSAGCRRRAKTTGSAGCVVAAP